MNVAVVSYRLGARDGVSVEAAKWIAALRELGHRVRTVAGEGPVDVVVSELALGAVDAPRARDLTRALEGADVVVVENLASLPLRPVARDVLYEVLEGRRALFRHHDLSWQRAHLAHLAGPRDAPGWRHVTINEISRRELLARGVTATTLYNHFDVAPALGRRDETRRALEVAGPLLVQPTRALARKNIPGALALAEALDATWWLLGEAEDGYGDEFDALLDATSVPVRRGLPEGVTVADAYAASDLVVMPSTWEGFGNPTVESVTHRRPLALYPYPVSHELRALGLRFYDLDDVATLREVLVRPDAARAHENLAVVVEHLNLADLADKLDALWRDWGWNDEVGSGRW